jgi:hypothetical protein
MLSSPEIIFSNTVRPLMSVMVTGVGTLMAFATAGTLIAEGVYAVIILKFCQTEAAL